MENPPSSRTILCLGVAVVVVHCNSQRDLFVHLPACLWSRLSTCLRSIYTKQECRGYHKCAHPVNSKRRRNTAFEPHLVRALTRIRYCTLSIPFRDHSSRSRRLCVDNTHKKRKGRPKRRIRNHPSQEIVSEHYDSIIPVPLMHHLFCVLLAFV